MNGAIPSGRACAPSGVEPQASQAEPLVPIAFHWAKYLNASELTNPALIDRAWEREITNARIQGERK